MARGEARARDRAHHLPYRHPFTDGRVQQQCQSLCAARPRTPGITRCGQRAVSHKEFIAPMASEDRGRAQFAGQRRLVAIDLRHPKARHVRRAHAALRTVQINGGRALPYQVPDAGAARGKARVVSLVTLEARCKMSDADRLRHARCGGQRGQND